MAGAATGGATWSPWSSAKASGAAAASTSSRGFRLEKTALLMVPTSFLYETEKKTFFLKTDSWMIGLKLLAMIPDLLDFMLMLKWKQNKKKHFFKIFKVQGTNNDRFRNCDL